MIYHKFLNLLILPTVLATTILKALRASSTVRSEIAVEKYKRVQLCLKEGEKRKVELNHKNPYINMCNVDFQVVPLALSPFKS